MTVTIKRGLNSVKLNRSEKYPVDRSFGSKDIVRTDRHTYPTDCFTRTAKVVGKTTRIDYRLLE